MAIFVVRHGETDLNAGRVIQWPDTPLSARGTRQAKAVGERFSAAPIGKIIASDYARAYSTAEAIQAANGAPLEVVTTLRERHYGDLRGKAYTELGIDPHAPDYEPPNGESWTVFHERVEKAWAEVLTHAAATAGDLCVVTHGLVLRSLVDRVLPTPDDVDVSVQVFRNTSVTMVEGPPWRATLVGCHTHLTRDLLADSALA